VCRGGVFEGVDGGSQHPLGVAADVQILRRCLELMGSWLGWLIGSHLQYVDVVLLRIEVLWGQTVDPPPHPREGGNEGYY